MQVLCDYCGKPAQLVNGSMVYNGRYHGLIWLCSSCNAWVGVHKGTNKPLGRLANADLRHWRREAHAAFDPMWRGKEKRTRRWAYEWLAEEMRLPLKETHIGMFDVEQCKKAVKICKEAKNNEYLQKRLQGP